jgi:hypothetical protein
MKAWLAARAERRAAPKPAPAERGHQRAERRADPKPARTPPGGGSLYPADRGHH